MNRAQRRAAKAQGENEPLLAQIQRPTPRIVDPKKPRVCLAYIHSDFQDALWVNSIRELERYDRDNDQHLTGDINVASGPLLARARNEAVRAFLNTDHNWLWFVDDDMVFRSDALSRMVELAHEKDRPLIGSLYYGGGHSAVIRPHIFTVTRDDAGNLCTEVREDFPRDEPFECHAVGAGSMLIHRKVLEAVFEKWSPHTIFPWFAETEANHRPFGEDVTFCMRAMGCGYTWWVDPSIWWGHSKRYIIDGEVYARQKAALAELEPLGIGVPS